MIRSAIQLDRRIGLRPILRNQSDIVDRCVRSARSTIYEGAPLVCNAACVRVDAHVPTHACTHASYVVRVYQEEEEGEESHHVWRRKIAPSASFPSISSARRRQEYSTSISLLPWQNLTLLLSPRQPLLIDELLQHARRPYLPLSPFLSPSLFRICRHDRNGRAHDSGN